MGVTPESESYGGQNSAYEKAHCLKQLNLRKTEGHNLACNYTAGKR